ncbi:MAG: ATP-binding protein [Sandarakinorhabdus sp.]|nr:ATP-binding protein [Sandarakinorhabdus sp.]
MSLPLVFDTCHPRDDVLKGQLAEGEFAARLGPVIARAGSPDYHDPVLFFRNTYPTKGLKELLDQVLRRLTGMGGSVSSVFRLDTSFGGGKTHGLIALIHAAREGSAVPNLNEFVEGVPATGGAAVAAFDGEAADPTNGRLMGDGIRAHTPWGEIAYQLGGAAGYATVKASDEARVAPGSDTMREVIGDRPALIVLDELGEYLRKCPEANGRDQLAAFIKAIFSAVESSPRAALGVWSQRVMV